MAVSVLEAALDALQPSDDAEPRSGGREDEDDEAETPQEDEDDEEAERETRAEEPEPAQRGDRAPPGGDEKEDRGDEAESGQETIRGGEPSARDEGEDGEPDEVSEDEDGHERHNGHRSELADVQLVRAAVDQLAQLLGRRPETVSRVEHRDDGWHLGLEVVELERIPHTTDVLASYDVMLDDAGELVEYARTRRYHRNSTDEEGY
jgi:hypothetical protein